MKTLEEWTTASITETAEIDLDAFNVFLDNWEYHQELIVDALDVVESLIKNNSSKERCQTASKHFHWKSQSVEVLEKVVSMVINHKYGVFFLKKILRTEKLADIKHFRKMVEGLNTVNFQTASFLFQEIDNKGKYFGDGKWWELAVQLANKTAQLLNEINDTAKWEAIATTFETTDQTMHPWFAREIAVSVCDHPYGYILLEQLASQKLMCFADLITIAKNTNLKMERWFKIALWEAMASDGFRNYGEYSALYPQRNRCRQCDTTASWNGKVTPW
jgi:hypothetical protein